MSTRSPYDAVSRRAFLRWLAAAGAGAALSGCGRQSSPEIPPPTETPPTATPHPATAPPPATESPAAATTAVPPPAAPTATPVPAQAAYLAAARGADPAAITMAALAAIGGIERFVKPGADVIIKPNICTDYYPYEYAATTNPEVVATLVRLALGAGAKRVRVMDQPFAGSAASAYARSGIEAAVQAAGGAMEVMNRNKYKQYAIPNGVNIQEWMFYQPVMEADLVINVPIAKHHSLARLTLGGKNLLGVITNPGGIHSRLHQRIADLVSAVRPALTVIDAVRTLRANGPTGGNLNDVRLDNTVIASHDIVAADAYAATALFEQAADSIGYIQAAAAMGLGSLDLAGLHIEEIAL